MRSVWQRFLAIKVKDFNTNVNNKYTFCQQTAGLQLDKHTCALEKKFARTRNKVTSNPIRPGTILGSTKKLIPPIITNTPVII